MKLRQWRYDNEALTTKQRQRCYANQAITMQQGSGHTPAMVAVDKEMRKRAPEKNTAVRCTRTRTQDS
eukprot:1585714-Lingulodinium_polyedra.AAC.1